VVRASSSDLAADEPRCVGNLALMAGRPWLIIGSALLATGVCVGVAVAMASANSSPADAPGYYRHCPHKDRDPRSQGDAAKLMLVPDGAYEALICRYRGLNPQPAQVRTLAYSRQLTRRATLRQLARQFNALKPWPGNGGTTSCPFGDASEVVAFFRYRRSPDDPVSAQLNGCRSVSNGQLGRDGLRDPGPRLLRHLERLTHCKRQGQPFCQERAR